MPRTQRQLAADVKSVKSISFRLSNDGNHIVVTNRYEEHNGRPILLSKNTLEAMLQQLEPTTNDWQHLTPEYNTTTV